MKTTYDDENEFATGSKDDVEPEKPPKSTFRVSIRAAQQGIAYLILDNGYNYMLAMQDALDEQKFQLFLTLIQKTADDTVVQKKNEKGQNLLHILAINSRNSENCKAVIVRIFKTLKSRGVDCLCTDNSGSNALHYAVMCKANEIVNLLLLERIDVNQVNDEGHSPLSLAMRGVPNSPLLEDKITESSPNYLTLNLLRHGADINIVYPESSHDDKRNGLKIVEIKQDSSAKNLKKERKKSRDPNSSKKTSKRNYKCTIMINYAQHNNIEKKE